MQHNQQDKVVINHVCLSLLTAAPDRMWLKHHGHMHIKSRVYFIKILFLWPSLIYGSSDNKHREIQREMTYHKGPWMDLNQDFVVAWLHGTDKDC